MPLAWSSLSGVHGGVSKYDRGRATRRIHFLITIAEQVKPSSEMRNGNGQEIKARRSWSRKTRFARVLDSNSERESGERRLRLLRDRGAKNDGMERFLSAKPGRETGRESGRGRGTGTGTNHAVAPNVSHRGTG